MNKLLKLIITMLVAINTSFGTKSDISKILKESSIKIKNPLELRDPFRKKARRGSSRSRTRGRILVDNKYSNLPVIESIELDKIRIVGVLLGEKRRAIARVASGDGDEVGSETYIVKEGMRLGLNKAEVKAIVPGGIVLVEKIRNVYEQDEYIETVIPITTPTKTDDAAP